LIGQNSSENWRYIHIFDFIMETMALTHHITGPVANKRIIPLLQAQGINLAEAMLGDSNVDFMWENTPSKERKSIRDGATVYSHLAQGHILEDKWALALLQQKIPAGSCPLLESHCLRGRNSVVEWCSNRWSLEEDVDAVASDDLWVLKDAESNGAGGIWILSRNNWHKLSAKEGEPLHEGHRYVAQKYVNHLALWKGRKFHIRTYVVVSADLGVYIHRKAFLHIANKMFARAGGSEGDDEVHITNCCANSGNKQAFAGEIVIDDLTNPAPYPGTGNENTNWNLNNKTAASGDSSSSISVCENPTTNNNNNNNGGVSDGDISFATGFKDMCSILSSLIDAAAPFLEAQTSQRNFEYMGVDFMIDENGRAWILECNCPPSQDTATGLPHAEELHNAVMSDVLGTFVLPHFLKPAGDESSLNSPSSSPPPPPPPLDNSDDDNSLVSMRYKNIGGWVEARKPSQLPFSPATKTTGNNMRWKMYESKCLRKPVVVAGETIADDKAAESAE
jgi:hypothetical protein